MIDFDAHLAPYAAHSSKSRGRRHPEDAPGSRSEFQRDRDGIVPVVEPEVVGDGDPGDHSIARCEDVTGETLEAVFSELRLAGVAAGVGLGVAAGFGAAGFAAGA